MRFPNTSYSHDIWAFFAPSVALDPIRAGQGGSPSGTWIYGRTLDRRPELVPDSLDQNFASGAAELGFLATLSANATLYLYLKWQHSHDAGVTWSDYTYRPSGSAHTPAIYLAQGGVVGASIRDVLRQPIDLDGAGLWVRCGVSPVFSAPADFAILYAIAEFGGGPNLPADRTHVGGQGPVLPPPPPP